MNAGPTNNEVIRRWDLGLKTHRGIDLEIPGLLV